MEKKKCYECGSVEKKKYPIRAEDYELFELIGDGGTAVVHRARCIPFDEIVAVKILDFERNSDLSTISREAQTMILIDHPNVVRAHCSFVIDHNLWVVMPYMAGGSCLHIMKSAFPNGFEEVVIATILREVLKGIEYLHQQGHIHRDIKAGNILLDSRGGVKLGDFGVSACLFDSGDRQRTRKSLVGTPCWMAPEVMEGRDGYDFKADIWSFGITALELAHGHAPFSSQPPAKVFLMTLQNAPPSLESSKDKKFSKSFKHMIATCLVKDPTQRPTAHKLLKKSFFKQARSPEYISRKILEGLPTLVDRFQALKRKEAELFAQKKMLDGEKEAISQDEYKRGISNWKFDIDDLKAQASLIPDEDAVIVKDSEGCSNYVPELATLHENIPHVTSSSSMNGASVENGGMIQSRTDSHSSSNQHAKVQSDQNGAQLHCNGTNDASLNHKSEINGRHPDNRPSPSFDDNGTSTSSSSHESVKQHNQEKKTENCSKSTAPNSDEIDEKSKATVVQQKGRFKVTSENIGFDKAHQPSSQPASPRMQLEATDEREKQLLQEIADLQKRLVHSEEELRRIRAKNAQDAGSKLEHNSNGSASASSSVA